MAIHQRCDLVEGVVNLMGFERQEDIVLHAQLMRVRTRVHVNGEIFRWGDNPDAVGTNRIKRLSPGDHADFALFRPGKMTRDISANRAAPKNAHLQHVPLSCKSVGTKSWGA
jgi:hypothetical protein